MDAQTVLAGLDRLYAEGNAAGIETYLRNHIFQAQMEGDAGIRLTLNNELMGLYRTLGRYREGLQIYEETLDLLRAMGLVGTVHYAGTLTNAATMCRAAGWLERAEELFAEALTIYEKNLDPGDLRLASMYNNLGLLRMDRQKYAEAGACLEKSLGIIARLPDTEEEQATNHTNQANLCMALQDLPEAERHLAIADRLYAGMDYRSAHVGSFLYARARLEVLLGNDPAASAHYRSALDAIERRYGRSRSYAITQKELARVLRRLGETAEAEALEAESETILATVR